MGKSELEMSIFKVKMKCTSCGKEVKTKLIKFGDAYIAVCPVCKQLAYNTKFKDSKSEEKLFKKGCK
ncbi:MAG TPA: hypothetical protein VFD40_01530 [Candidatus Paceibacterota bacterium]|nr:hypothetical protein [Candidatus Paceibacterota bacterium]